MEAGADVYLSNPVVFAQLVEQIETLLSCAILRAAALG